MDWKNAASTRQEEGYNMKKLICALVLLAMLVPVAAMAAAPAARISLADLVNGRIEGEIGFYSDPAIKISTDDYVASYYMSGELRDYTLVYGTPSETFGGVYTTFTPDDQVQDIVIRKYSSEGGPGAMWNYVDEFWFDIRNPEKHVELLDQYHPNLLGANVSRMKMNCKTPDKNNMPPMQLEDVLKEYGYEGSFDLMESSLADIKTFKIDYDNDNNRFLTDLGMQVGEGITVLVNGRPAQYDSASGKYVQDYSEQLMYYRNGTEAGPDVYAARLDSVVLIKGNIISILYTNGEPCEGVTAIGPAYYNSFMDSYMIRGASMDGERILNAEYGKDGERNVYFVYGDNYNTQTAYDNYNRMVTHEYWDSNFRYWLYEKDRDGNYVWYSSPNGGSEEYLEEDTPTEEVLLSLALTKAVAEYSVGVPVAGIDDVAKSMEGLPFILDNGSSLGGADVSVTNTLVNETTTEFDISPMKGDEKVQPNTPVKMYLPLPAGMDVAEAKKYDISIVHNGESYNTKSGNLEITENGLGIVAEKYSTYTVLWGAEATRAYEKYPAAKAQLASPVASALPSTGDNSNLLAYACLLLASAAALAMLGKRRAHQ